MTRKIHKLELELLKFAEKHSLKCIRGNYATEVYLNENLFTYDTENEIPFATYQRNIGKITFGTGLQVEINTEHNVLSIEYDSDESSISRVSQFHKIEKTYEILMEKLIFLNKLIKDHKIDIRKNELDKDFK